MKRAFTVNDGAPLIFGATAGKHLSKEVCRHLGQSEGELEIQSFSDGETGVKVLDNVRGADVYLIQSTCPPVNQNLMELLLLTDALKRASARKINLVMPYYGYARQDRKEQGRVAISAKLIANILTAAGADRVICLDLHSAQIQGFFDIPVDHLYGGPVLTDYIMRQGWTENVTVVSPDVGNVKMTRAFANRINAPLAIIDKRRPRANISEVMNIIGDVKGRNCILVDDLIDTAGTLCNGAGALMAAGALKVMACATHAVLSGPALDRLAQAPIDRLIVTNSVDCAGKLDKMDVVDIAPMLAEAIDRIHNHKSISELFESQKAQIPPTSIVLPHGK